MISKDERWIGDYVSPDSRLLLPGTKYYLVIEIQQFASYTWFWPRILAAMNRNAFAFLIADMEWHPRAW